MTAAPQLDLAEVQTPRDLAACLEALRAELARDDARLKVALDDGGLGVTQTLAAGPALIRWWEQAESYGAAIISAAADARRLGVTSPLTRALLNDAAYGYLSPAARASAGPDWLDHALTYATTPLLGAASAVAPVDGGVIGVLAGYRIADFLLQHARATRRTVTPPDAAWQALLGHATDLGTLQRLGDQAELRLQYGHAETAYRALADADDSWGVVALTLLLHTQGRDEHAQALALELRRQATGSSRGTLRWNLLTGLMVLKREVRERLREGRFAEAMNMERREPDPETPRRQSAILEPPTDADLDKLKRLADDGDDSAAMWIAVLAAQHGATPRLLAEVRAGTPLAAELYLMRLESTDPSRTAFVRRHGLTIG